MLEAGNALPVGAIALITDGKVDAPGSPYASPTSAAWAQLKARATALSGKHEIAAYALSLVSATDAALLKQVFPSATDIPAAQVSGRLSSLQNELLKSQAIERLKPDLAKTVTAGISGIDWADLPAAGGDLTGTLTLTSGFAQVPATVEGVTLTASGLPLTFIAAPPASIDLVPGASTTIPVTVHVPAGMPAGDGTVRVAGTVTSAWSDALTKSLGLAFAPKLDASISAHTAGVPVTPPAPASPAMPPWVLPAAGAAAALLLLLLLLLRLRAPRMVGSLAITRDGRLLREFLLAGRKADLADSATPDLTGTVTAAKGTGPTVQVAARASGGQRTRQRLGDTETLDVGPYRITYTSQHTRTLSMVRTGLDEPPS